MSGLTPIEAPRVTAEYGQLSPDIHAATERIVGQRTDSSFRVRGINEEALGIIREVLEAAEGSHLPAYRWDEDGNDVPMGRTPIVQERHTRVFALDHQTNLEDGDLWLRVPPYSEERQPTSETKPTRQFSKRELLALGVGGVAAEGMFAAGMATEKVGFIVGWATVASAVCVAAIRKVGRSQVPRPSH